MMTGTNAKKRRWLPLSLLASLRNANEVLGSAPLCRNGLPELPDAYCGRGGGPCPEGFECFIHPGDRFAVCCPTEYPIEFKVYEADLTPLGSNAANGYAVVFAGSASGREYVGYAGLAYGLEPDLDSSTSDCDATNGCGVHVHSGTACTDSTTQGGHLYQGMTTDPWLDETYESTDSNGNAEFANFVDMGTGDVEGKPFIFHANDGSRVACGILREVTQDAVRTKLSPLTADGSTPGGYATVYANVARRIVSVAGIGTDLEPSLGPYPFPDSSSSDCSATNGCGAHVHAGTDCADSSTQMGHYYDVPTIDPDPWLTIGYGRTDPRGVGSFLASSVTGATDVLGRAFILHANDGSRVACGLLEEIPSEATTTGDPNRVPEVGECPLFPECCEHDCCGPYTSYDPSKGRCVVDVNNPGGFQGTYPDDREFGCVARKCCMEDCCDAGTTWDGATLFCVSSILP